MVIGIGTRLGPYEVLEPIGSGGMGHVFRARDTRLHRDVAIKVLPAGVAENPKRRARFEREARALSGLTHPNICPIYDVGEYQGIAYLVMEYVEGESLDARLRQGPLTRDLALRAAIEIAAAVAAAHDRGIVHRDLKPANLMMGKSGIKLLDFGIAKLLDEDADTQTAIGSAPTAALTAEHQVIGTPNYMAPEQLEGRAIDRRADVFALGAVIYEMLTGRKAFDGSSVASVTAAVLTADPLRMSSEQEDASVLPPAIAHVIRRALEKDPDERWQSVRDLMHELRWILEGAAKSGLPPPTAQTSRHRRLAVPAGIVAIAIALASVVGWAIGAGTRRPSSAAAVMFPIPAPEGTQLYPGYGALAVSPDGLKIAFLAMRNNVSSIWVRALNTTVARQLFDTEGANGPFWSPDSESIGFFADDNLRIKRVDVDGSKPVVVVELPASDKGQMSKAAACWMPDDTIVFGYGSGLARVPAKSGTQAPLVTPDSARNERAFTYPAVLPGGRVVYMASRNFAFENQVAAAAGRVTLPTVGSNASYSAGHLIFRQGSSLVAQAFDPDALRFTGTPTPIVEGVDYNTMNQRTVFSAAASVLAYRPDAPSKLTWFARDGTRLRSIGMLRDRSPAIAPDGSGRVAVDRFDPSTAESHIWVIDARDQATDVTHDRGRHPLWSGDSTSIAYGFGTPSGAEIHRSSASGAGGGKVLFSAPGSASDWSRDGSSMIFVSKGDLWLVRLTDPSHAPTPLTRTATVSEEGGRFSPDGNWIAYAAADAEGRKHIWILKFPDGTPQQISGADGAEPTWRGDSKELYYISSAGKLTAIATTSDTPLTFGPPSALFSVGVAHGARTYDVSADGQRFIVSEPAEREQQITVIVNWPALIKR